MAQLPQPPRKPTGGVVALGWISIVYSSFFYVCCSGVTSFASPFIFKVTEKFLAQQGFSFHMTQAMWLFTFLNGFVYVVLGVTIIIAGIGLLQLRQWARGISIWSAVAIIAWAIIVFVITLVFFYPQYARMMEGHGDVTAQMIGSLIGNTIGLIFQLAYPVVLIICLNLSPIKSQFSET